MSHSTTKRARAVRRGKAFFLTAVAFTGLALSAPPANAEELPSVDWDHRWWGNGVTVYVEEYGDIIATCDNEKNGYSAYAEVFVGPYLYFYYSGNASGVGTCDVDRASDGGYHDLPEGETISLLFDGAGKTPSSVTFVNDH